MSEPLSCPRCDQVLTDSEVRSLHKRYASAQRKTRSGGKNGGRRKLTPEQIKQAGAIVEPLIAEAWAGAYHKVYPQFAPMAQPQPDKEAGPDGARTQEVGL